MPTHTSAPPHAALRLRWLATALALAACPLPAMAADTPAPTPRPASAKTDPLAAARARIAAKDFAAAVDTLMAARDERSADWHNLLGYAIRNLPTPDFTGAELHYNEALRINPLHRGALEYSGQLYLLTGQRAKAEARLAELAKACPSGCEELADLKAAMAKAR